MADFIRLRKSKSAAISVAANNASRFQVLQITGRAAGTASTTATINFSATEDVDVSAVGDVTIVSVTRTNDSSYKNHSVVISCANERTGAVLIANKHKIASYGNHGGAANPSINFYTGTDATSPILNWDLNAISRNAEKIRQSTAYTNILPAVGNQSLPTGLTYLNLYGNSIAWTYTGALPTGLTYLYLNSSSIAWTGLDVGNNGNIGTFSLLNYRIIKMSSADMVTLLTQLTNRTGSLPATITINDYADYASPPAEVTAAVAALKSAKPNITTVNLGA